MTALVRAELRQLRKTPVTWGLVAAALLLCLAWTVIVLTGVGGIESPPRGSMRLRDALFGASSFGCLPVLLLGALAMTSEFHHRTATFAFLAVPARSRVVAAKTLASAREEQPGRIVFAFGQLGPLGGEIVAYRGDCGAPQRRQAVLAALAVSQAITLVEMQIG